MKKLACFFLFSALLLFAQDLPLCDLNSEPLETGLTARSATICKVDSGWQIDYPAWRKGEEEWPAIIIDPGKGLLEGDWLQRKYLTFTIYNPGEAFTIELRIDDANGDTTNTNYELAAGEATTCFMATQSIADREMLAHQMTSWNLFLSRPEKKHTIVLQHLALSDEPYTEAAWIKICERAATRLTATRQELAKAPATSYQSATLLRLDDELALLRAPKRRDEQKAWLDQNTPQKAKGLLRNNEFFRNRPDHGAQPGVVILPATIKLRQDQFPAQDKLLKELKLDAARGEGENLQLLVFSGKEALEQIKVSATNLTEVQTGATLEPRLNVVAYIPVKKPTLEPFGFGEKGLYPDPLCPNEPFALEPFTNRSVWFSVNVPEDAKPGRYSGQVAVDFGNGATTVIPAELVVHDVLLPRHGRIKTCWIHRNEGSKPQYYGENWTRELQEAWFRQCIEYRLDADEFGSSAILPWNTVFTDGPGGKILADWSQWDAAYDRWYALGRNTFLSLNAPDVSLGNPIPDQENWRSQRFRLLEQHLVERGIYDNFYMYLFDEPQPKFADGIKEICRWVHRQGSHLNLILTSCHDNEQTYFDDIDIFVPHADIFDPVFGEKCRAAGKKYWAYTCIGTFTTTYPDSWKIDNYGTGHRALGWWLFKYGSQGYLYWGLDYWMVNPWEDAETYPNGNGDGSLFYPAPDHKSLPYPALRAALVRDGFEDYELLWMLKEKYAQKPPRAVKRLLKAQDIIGDSQDTGIGTRILRKFSRHLVNTHYAQDSDLLLIQKHRELLELLEK
ncbi:MAG: DUF4091 domain-containing protein [Victivallales bacterium]|nr:DUF4091 domain-containing protein [Victivallales bacterium]